MTSRTNRRDFLKTTAAAGVGFWVAGGVAIPESRAAIETINFACIGVDGKGSSDSADCERNGNIVAICDVDEHSLAKAADRPGFQKAKKYTDFRKMLEEMGKEFDAVTVSTPDHTHAAAASMAMRMGKHCFTQKPLTHTIAEARKLGELAVENKVATQMGNQGTANNALRLGAAAIQAGVIGNVKEVHVFTNRPIWPQGIDRPDKSDPVPSHLHWEEWLGPAKFRPYVQGIYHPFAWRGWWDFGTGALGDMACHTVNMPFAALGLRDPVSVVAKTSGHNKETYPGWSIIDFEFPATDKRPAVKMVWYDGKMLPPVSLLEDKNLATCEPLVKALNWKAGVNSPSDFITGSLLIGDKGALFGQGDYGDEMHFIGVDAPKGLEYKRSPGHFKEWVNAIKGGEPAMSNFPNYAGPLTETILLGNLAVWADGTKVEWDATTMSATNAPELKSIVFPEYREGYTL